jgi:DNA-directed RNA polymerase subunit RPC12/RpoP
MRPRGTGVGEFDGDDGPVEGSKTSASTLPCGQCGAELEFKPGTTVLKCQYCGHSQTIEIKAGAAVIEYDLNDAISRYLGNAGHMQQQGNRNVKCGDCGAEVMVAAGSQTARCDYCGGKSIIEEELPAGVLQPESLLPFTFDSASAVERFRKWLKGGEGFFGRLWVKLIRPGELQQRANVQDLHGIYVPFWTYDSNSHSNWTAQAGYHYYVTEHYTDSQGKRQSRQVQKTRWVWTSGHRRDFFNDWLVCASAQYYQPRLSALMKKIEPFPTQGLTPYDSKYLAGFRAERYSVDLKAGWEHAREGMQAELYSRCGRDVPGDTHRFLEVRTTYFGQSFKHVLLPVFTMGYQFKDKPYNVLVNGCTGEVQGEAPLSWVKVTILCIVIAALIGGGIALFMIFGQK